MDFEKVNAFKYNGNLYPSEAAAIKAKQDYERRMYINEASKRIIELIHEYYGEGAPGTGRSQVMSVSVVPDFLIEYKHAIIDVLSWELD